MPFSLKITEDKQEAAQNFNTTERAILRALVVKLIENERSMADEYKEN